MQAHDDDEHQAASDAGLDGSEEPVRPTEDRSRPIRATFTTAQLESLSDSAYAPPGDWWPSDWIPHQRAHGDALSAVERVLDGDPGLDVIGRLEDLQERLGHLVLAEVTRAGRDADCVAIGATLHLVDGCHHARRAHPLSTAGGYRGRAPRFLSTAQGERWLASGHKRKRCRRCYTQP
jgi:hypothetical protein